MNSQHRNRIQNPLTSLTVAFAIAATLTAQQPRLTPWTDSHVVGSPEPPAPYRAEVAFPQLKLAAPVTISNAPNTERLFVVQVRGEIVSFPEEANIQQKDVLIDLRDHIPNLANVYGLTFHPEYPAEPYFYVCYVLRGNESDGSVISRFTVNQFNPPRADPDSERKLLRWLAGGHNGCSLKFGPDGYLYASMGDGTGPTPPDILRAGQDLTNLLSTIVRIDVNSSTAEQPYRIPADNPFVGMSNARPEIWAYGFRNPWKMSFDRIRGDLWVGDVGWDMWELVYRVERGGNYGWSIMEGSNPIHPTEPRGPTPILPPVVQHHHSEARSVTGGFVYHGLRHPDLQGAYIYGDYNTGKMWALRCEGDRVVDLKELAQTSLQIVAFGETNVGELYFADYQRTNKIYQLTKNDGSDASTGEFPRRLSETGLFESVAELAPAPGVEPYRINAQMWEDGAIAERHLALPEDSQIQIDPSGNWRFPPGSVALRTLSLPISSGEARRLETQMLHFDGKQWNPYSYAWLPGQDDAELVPARGTILKVDVGKESHPLADEHGEVSWHVESRVNCRVCHAKDLGGVLGLNLRQLHAAAAGNRGLLEDWTSRGIFANGPSSAALDQDTFVDPYDAGADLNARARTYLHVNCVSCHRTGGGGPSPMRVQFDLTFSQTGFQSPPVQGSLGLQNARIVQPGRPHQSVLFYRMAKVGSGHMPHLGAQTVDPDGLQLVHDWISELPESPTTQWNDAAIEQALASPRDTLRLAMSLHRFQIRGETRTRIVQRALQSQHLHVRDLLEPFYPASQRKRRLGTGYDSQEILSRTGNPASGQKVFRNPSLQCVACHQVRGEGGQLGPPLDEIGKKYQSAVEMLRTIRFPSEKIDPDYATTNILTSSGESIVGRVIGEAEGEVVVLTVDRKTRSVPREDIDEVVKRSTSLMPENLLQSLTAQEAADLLSYLATLKTSD